MSAMTDAATSLGAVKARIGIQQDFVKTPDGRRQPRRRPAGRRRHERGSSTKLQALQVKQQLGVQALGIANTSSQSIMQLFQ